MIENPAQVARQTALNVCFHMISPKLTNMRKVYAGTSGWAYPSWKPDFYPAKLKTAEFLRFYGTRLNSVELNYTFRRFPTDKVLTGWITATPPDFQFGVKAHQTITHVKRLRGVEEFTSQWIAALRPLEEAGKLGPVLFQLPPFLKCDLTLLGDFLASLPRGVRSAFEFRHESWFSDEVFALLRQANAALCQAESEKLETPRVETGNFSYLRLRKETYPPKTRKALAQQVSELASKGDVFVYFKHEESAEGALYAEELLAAEKSGQCPPRRD
jgi:uncharacterized protein YecE (DUF72 family)